jgi:BirA family biotin operon repressor/biotin-[acetyl-CoA-carboxylase] ligase
VLPLAAGVAVAEAVESLGVSPRLKWPNDVMIDERKLGGILAESSSAESKLEWVVLGMGLNVNAALPEDLRDRAISLAEARASSVDLEALAAAVLGRVAVWYHRVLDGGPRPVVSAWRERAMPWWGRRVVAWSGEGRVEGRAIGIDDAGGLVLETDDGARITLRSGEVSSLRHAG